MRNRQTIGIGNITVQKAELIEILVDNRAQHRAAFESAVKAWQERAHDEINQMARRVGKGEVFALWIQIPTPEEHTADYTRAIEMFNMHQGATIELSEEAFSRLVNDEWGWREQWLANTASYNGASN